MADARGQGTDLRLCFRQAQFGLFAQFLFKLHLVAQMFDLATVFLLRMDCARGGAPGGEGVVFDPDIAILHEFAPALRGVGLAGRAGLGYWCLCAACAAGRGLALAQPFKGLPECGFIYFFPMGVLVFFFREGKKIIVW
ncbi:hypothetical protein AA16373_2537 [Komagataeibacter swingsii DSM 16373]|nr:hypothetical protein AA16373_2537 [Komagataeibacter swingsii DSM 16373]